MRSLLIIALLFFLSRTSGNIIEVGTGKPFTTVREAIKSARNGDTIMIGKGKYEEGNLIIDKSLHLIGVNFPVLDGNFKHEILTLTGKQIVVSGIHFANPGYSSMNDFAAIKIIDPSRVLIENNQITNPMISRLLI